MKKKFQMLARSFAVVGLFWSVAASAQTIVVQGPPNPSYWAAIQVIFLDENDKFLDSAALGQPGIYTVNEPEAAVRAEFQINLEDKSGKIYAHTFGTRTIEEFRLKQPRIRIINLDRADLLD